MTLTYLCPKKVTLMTQDLKCCEQLLLWSIRTWVIGYRQKYNPKTELQRAYSRHKIPEAYAPLDHFMYCLSFGPKRTIDINCPLKGSITADEITLLNIFAAYQNNSSSLGTCMLAKLCQEQYLFQAKFHAVEFCVIFGKDNHMRLSTVPLNMVTHNAPAPQMRYHIGK